MSPKYRVNPPAGSALTPDLRPSLPAPAYAERCADAPGLRLARCRHIGAAAQPPSAPASELAWAPAAQPPPR